MGGAEAKAMIDDRTGADTQSQSQSQSQPQPQSRAAPQRLRGWKMIAQHFGVDERTAKRWEAQRGLPVHRVPGEARAPVFAYTDELTAWVEGGRGPVPDTLRAEQPAGGASARHPWLTVALVFLVVAAGTAVWMGVRADEQQKLASEQAEELKLLARAQVAAMNDQLDSLPGTVAARSALAQEAVQVLGRVAGRQPMDAALKREAAEGYRRLAVVQNAVDRPSLRDRTSARDSLNKAVALLAGDKSDEAAMVLARVQIEAARQVSGDGNPAAAEDLLLAARAVALAPGAGALADDWWLAQSEIQGWKGEYRASAEAARRVGQGPASDPQAALRQLKALDLEGEALYYLGDLAGAEAGYARAVAVAEAAAARWPRDNRLRWGVLRQQWNLGSTLVQKGQGREAVPILRASLAGWEALMQADPSDEAVQAWVQALRLSYGQALGKAGNMRGAITELSRSVAERRTWLQQMPDNADRRRMLLKSQASLADLLVPAGRIAEACSLYTEAAGLSELMEKAGQLTTFDRSETLTLLQQARLRACGALDD